MDFGKSFSYVFKDPDWIKKVLIAALISLIPLVGQIYLLGWALGVTQRIIRGQQDTLPEIEFGEALGRGFKSFVIALVYSIPTILLALPIVLTSVLGENMDPDMYNTVVLLLSLCCGGLILIYSLIIAVLIPAAHGNFLAANRLGAAFNIGQVFGLVKAAPGPYLMILLGILIVGLITPLGLIACIVGVLVTSVYGTLIISHMYGQAYNAAKGMRF
jgi:hypothetical protein